MSLRTSANSLAVAAFMFLFLSAAKSQTPASQPAAWHSDHVVYIAGLPDLPSSSDGVLQFTPEAVAFTGRKAAGEIPLNRITAVSTGDERVATGGTGAKVARAIPIFGFGAAMGAVTNRSVDLLTIEYLDKDGGYHGAVFEVPKAQAAIAQQQLAAHVGSPTAMLSLPCNGRALPNTILVEPVSAPGVQLPAEYHVLLYEQLVNQLGVFLGAGSVYRVGDSAAPCVAMHLQLSVLAFKKGNEAVRASTGPAGLFVGGTSVTFHVNVLDKEGAVVFEKSLKANKRGDGDSLNVTRDLAKSVAKRLVKAKTLTSPALS